MFIILYKKKISNRLLLLEIGDFQIALRITINLSSQRDLAIFIFIAKRGFSENIRIKS